MSENNENMHVVDWLPAPPSEYLEAETMNGMPSAETYVNHIMHLWDEDPHGVEDIYFGGEFRGITAADVEKAATEDHARAWTVSDLDFGWPDDA